MTKTELIERIAQNQGITKKMAGEILDTTLDTIATAVSSGDDVRLSGFGSFKRTTTKARMGRNPATGAEIKIAAKHKVVFKSYIAV